MRYRATTDIEFVCNQYDDISTWCIQSIILYLINETRCVLQQSQDLITSCNGYQGYIPYSHTESHTVQILLLTHIPFTLLTLKWLGHFFQYVISFSNVVHHKRNILIWNWSNKINISSALWILMAWCFSTRASVATLLTMHTCVSRCLGVNMSNSRYNWLTHVPKLISQSGKFSYMLNHRV